MRACDILTLKGDVVRTIRPEETLGSVCSSLQAARIGALVVSVDGKRIEGIISERDVITALVTGGTGALDRACVEFMSTEVVSCGPEDEVERLMHVMTEQRIRHLPVVDDGAEMIGIVSIGDVVKARLGQLESENQALFGYITGR
jgi:CBS domain-containing protein